MVDDGPGAFFQQFAGFRRYGTDGGSQHRFVRNDVGSVAGLEFSHGDHGHVPGRRIAGDDRLQRHHDFRARDDGVHAQLRHGAMGTLPLNGEEKTVRRGRGGPRRQNADGPGRFIGHHMRTEDGVYAFENSTLDDRKGAPGRFFLPGLENEIHRAGQFLLHGGKNLGCSQQHGRVHVMPAGMAYARCFAGKGKSCLLLHGKRVHVRPEADGFPGLSAAQNADHGGLRRPQDFNVAERGKQIRHIIARLVFFKRQFRILMDMVPPLHGVPGGALHLRLLRHGRKSLEKKDQQGQQ